MLAPALEHHPFGYWPLRYRYAGVLKLPGTTDFHAVLATGIHIQCLQAHCWQFYIKSLAIESLSSCVIQTTWYIKLKCCYLFFYLIHSHKLSQNPIEVNTQALMHTSLCAPFLSATLCLLIYQPNRSWPPTQAYKWPHVSPVRPDDIAYLLERLVIGNTKVLPKLINKLIIRLSYSQ